MPYELPNELFGVVVDCPFKILRLARNTDESAMWPSEGTYVGQMRQFELVFCRRRDRKRVPNAPFPCVRWFLVWHVHSRDVSLHLLRAEVTGRVRF